MLRSPNYMIVLGERSIFAPFLLHNMLNILAISRFNCPYISFLRYFGANNNVILTIPFRVC